MFRTVVLSGYSFLRFSASWLSVAKVLYERRYPVSHYPPPQPFFSQPPPHRAIYGEAIALCVRAWRLALVWRASQFALLGAPSARLPFAHIRFAFHRHSIGSLYIVFQFALPRCASGSRFIHTLPTRVSLSPYLIVFHRRILGLRFIGVPCARFYRCAFGMPSSA